MERDMLLDLYELLVADERLAGVTIKSFERPESLGIKEASIVLKPVSSPIQTAMGSNTSLAKRYLIQVNVESGKRLECKKLQRIVEEVFEGKRFYQVTDAISNLEDYIADIGRYVDVRTYRGRSALYSDY
ncbi:TPA: hypothetical protein U0K44_002076 [Streptococcus suis]|nr:hypothetical protein [Streptococcus suis]